MKALSSNGLKLAHILEDMITQIRSTPALYGLAREATSLADELGFKTPPVEFVELRPPDKHPLLKEHVAGVLVLRIHDRVGRTFAQIDLAVFAPEITLLPQPGDEMIDNARVLLETWKREVDRLGENHTPMQQPAREAGTTVQRVARILRSHPYIRPSAYAGNVRLFDNEAVAQVRYVVNRLDARRQTRKEARHEA